MKWPLQIFLKLPLHILAVPIVLVIRLIRPWLLVRWHRLNSTSIGHFVGNTEMYLCEKDASINIPIQRYVDFFYISKPICNEQLTTMWKRVLCILPAWMLIPISRVNRMIPRGAVHEVGTNTQHDRDVHNLLDRFPPHLEFTPAEMARGEACLRRMGIPSDTLFVCLIVRDDSYHSQFYPDRDVSYHNYRDSNIQNYVLAAEQLAERGYFVVRMGAKVRDAMKTSHPRIIDYATNGMRSDFMDIYLGATCAFCISTGTGFDGIPETLRRPIVYVNFVPLGYLHTFKKEVVSITKKHISKEGDRILNMHEIFNREVGFSIHASDYESKGVKLIENTPEEVCNAVIEMAERLNGTWQPHPDDEALQRRFWEIFSTDAVDTSQGRPLHGEIRSRFGAHFLRNNRDWLQ